MQRVSRRAVLIAGMGVTAVAAAAGGGYGLVEAGILPGKYRLAQVLGQCGAGPPAPAGPLPAQEDAVFWSAYRKRLVRTVTLIPAAAHVGVARTATSTWPSSPIRSASTTPPVSSFPAASSFAPAPSSPFASSSRPASTSPPALGVVIALHGLGSDALGAASLYAPAMTAAGVTGFALIAVDGGATYWHQRADGDDPLGMICCEVLPRAAARGLAAARIGIIGYSMGGYGALLLAERLGAGLAGPAADQRPGTTVAAVAAASPAIFASYRDARAADPGGFDDPADFARNDVMAGLRALRGVPAWVACGVTDPFEPVTQVLRSRLGELAGDPPAGGIEAGCHDEAFWARSAPAGLRFLARHVREAAPGGQAKRDA